MTDSHNNSSLVIILALSTFLLTSCATGFVSFSAEDSNSKQPVDLRKASIMYAEPISPNLLFSLQRTLRERYRVLDLQPLPKELPIGKNYFIIHTHHEIKTSLASNIMLFTSFFTFAIMPGVWTENHTLGFTLTSGPDERNYQYSWHERSYSWLPLFFIPHDFDYSINGGNDYLQNEKLHTLDKIVTHFIDDATPFLISHMTQTGG